MISTASGGQYHQQEKKKTCRDQLPNLVVHR